MINWRKTIFITSLALLFGLGLGCATWLLIPGFIETRILPRLAKEAGFPSFFCRINHFGLTQASAGPLTLGAGKDPALTIERIALLYNPTSITKGELNKVVLSGVSIKTVFSKGTLSIPGLGKTLDKNFDNKNTENEHDKRSTSTSRLPVPLFTKLLIERSVIIVEAAEKEYRIPFTLRLQKKTTPKPETYRLYGTLEIRPRNSPFTLKFRTNLDTNAKIHLDLQADKVDLLNFADILQMLPGLELKGYPGLRAEAELGLTPLALESLKANIVWPNGELDYNDFHISAAQNPDPQKPKGANPDPQNLKPEPEPEPETETFVLDLQKNSVCDPWRLKINQLYLDAPFSPALSKIEFTIETSAANTSLQGTWETRLTKLRHGLFTSSNPFHKKWSLTAKFKPQGLWQAVLKSPTDNLAWAIQRDDITIKGNSPTISINASGLGNKGEIEWQTLIKKPTLKNNRGQFSSPAIKADGHIAIESSNESRTIVASTLIEINKTHIKQQNLKLELPELTVQGEVRQKDSNTPQIKTRLQFKNGTLQASDYGLRGLDISGDLPWDWPGQKTTAGRKGRVDCRKIFWQELDLGNLSASLEQHGQKILFQGHHESALLQGLRLRCDGQGGLNQKGELQAHATFETNEYKPKTPINLGLFKISADGNIIDGIFSANGALDLATRGVNGSATAIVKEAILRNDEKNLLISSINCQLELPELPSLRSAPEQTLNFDLLKAGNISSPGGTFTFQIEADKTLLLEKGQLSWCGGKIETQALRISPAIGDYQFTLYCDRLQLTELLEQLAQVEAQGRGSVNGRIPVLWKNGELTFDDGFLYSTPGQGGTVKISGGEIPGAGLPASNPQFTQLDLAREALKDYQYEWTKVKVNSEAEELILNLQFDGKPNLPLPFVYKKELGGFARVSAKSPGSNFQGISLDLNLRLPLNQILQYKGLSTILE